MHVSSRLAARASNVEEIELCVVLSVIVKALASGGVNRVRRIQEYKVRCRRRRRWRMLAVLIAGKYTVGKPDINRIRACIKDPFTLTLFTLFNVKLLSVLVIHNTIPLSTKVRIAESFGFVCLHELFVCEASAGYGMRSSTTDRMWH